ncbi:GNAT family N-acetyltransferase [Sediminivirga luteola]|jgi:GNAT superfamily N-acetyltransferase|uniref:N-acetyltransferase domain-containing protein n=1 Tax=Sediminivirga luteola TaxID=1774748 RepID=A0A8J2TXF8_9MICO|nr:GNAT family N-acetyltransferase [Sediminivirga luteola]MCI2266457.1 GNAT family N-acetyltransferase [Sediminivirga luteola]GGA11361.1 hypothetical protein GCM10011333_12780 [Sediminivirga luteola]
MSDAQPGIDFEKVSIVPFSEIDPLDLREFLVNAQSEFWEDRDLSGEHGAFWFRQFAEFGLVARYEGTTIGYLLGCVPMTGPAYIHLVAAHRDYRHIGVGTELYKAFIQNAKQAGASQVQATTVPGNSHTIAFHSALGFSGELVEDYAGPGNARVFFELSLHSA